MNIRILFSFLIVFAISLPSFSQVWNNTYDDPTHGEDKSNSVTTCYRNSHTYVVTTGMSTQLSPGDAVPVQVLTTIQYDEFGNMLWVQYYNTGGVSQGTQTITDVNGNVYVTGFVIGASGKDMLTIKYNPLGVQQWARTYNGLNNLDDVAYAITIDGPGHIVITGLSTTITAGTDIVTISYMNNGDLNWVRTFNGSAGGDDVAYAITVDGSGNIIITGYTTVMIGDAIGGTAYNTIEYDMSGNIRWRDEYSAGGLGANDMATGVAVDNSGNVYLTGKSMSPAMSTGTGYDYATIKINSNGTRQWVQRYDGAGNDDIATSIAVKNNDGITEVYVTGSSKRSGDISDFATIKYNSSGSRQWTSRISNSHGFSNFANSLSVNKTRNVLFVTGTISMSGSESKVFTARLRSADARLKSTYVYHGSANGNDEGLSVAAGSGGQDFYVAGYSAENNQGNDILSQRDDDNEESGPQYIESGTINTISIGTFSDESVKPSVSSLHQNYPNPFNPTTNIKFDVAAQTNVKIAVYNMLGEQVALLANSMMPPGSYEVSFNTSNLSSGVYFYELVTESFRDIKKMTVIK